MIYANALGLRELLVGRMGIRHVRLWATLISMMLPAQQCTILRLELFKKKSYIYSLFKEKKT